MGQAKRRGTFEERKAAAIARNEGMAEERKRKWQEYERANPTEKLARARLLSEYLRILLEGKS